MSKQTEALKLAQKAMGLIGADLVCEAAHHEKKDRHQIGEPCPIQARWHQAFAAIREALAEQPAQQQQCMEHGECFGGECIYPAPQPAQQQEPSEYVQKVIDALYENSDPVSVEAAELLEQMTQQQEPVAYVYEREVDGFGLRKDVKFLKPVEVGSDLYTSPPQRNPLTDEEIDKLPWGPHEGNPMTFAEGLRDFARAIEAAHGIKGDA